MLALLEAEDYNPTTTMVLVIAAAILLQELVDYFSLFWSNKINPLNESESVHSG